jgi:hypothetical protein
VTAIGAEKLDLLVPQFLPVAIELALALGADHPKNFRHGSSWTVKKFEIRSAKSKTNSSQINLKLGKSKTANPSRVCFEFCDFHSFEFVSNFGFRASGFLRLSS